RLENSTADTLRRWWHLRPNLSAWKLTKPSWPSCAAPPSGNRPARTRHMRRRRSGSWGRALARTAERHRRVEGQEEVGSARITAVVEVTPNLFLKPSIVVSL